jgi:Protein of unknown function (DUF1499)
MARRHIPDEPTSRLAIWARRIALFSFVAVLLSVIIVRSGVLEIGPALATFAGALALAGIAILLAFAAFVVIWRDGSGGIGYAMSAIGIGLLLVAYPAYLGLKAYRLPWITDITTDFADPPRYEVLARVRSRDANPVAYPGQAAAEKQEAAYPDLDGLEEETPPPVAYEAALAVINKRKWTIVLRRPPQGRRDGQIEAAARTPIMGFRDDVVVRVRAGADGSRIDVRSSSRYGSHDFGANADRVRSLIEDIEDAIGRQKPERPPAAPVAKKQKAQPKTSQPSAKR